MHERYSRVDLSCNVSICVQRYLWLLGAAPTQGVFVWYLTTAYVVGVGHEREKIIQAVVKNGLGLVQVWDVKSEVPPPNPPKQPTEFELGVVTLNEMNWMSHRLHLIIQDYNSRSFTGQNTKVWLFSLMRRSFLWTALIMLYYTNSSPCKYHLNIL